MMRYSPATSVQRPHHRVTAGKRYGATAVEFALVAPIFFVMCLGTIEFGRCLMVTELLTEAARKGCRKGIIEGTTTQQIRDAAINFLSTVGINGETVRVIINDGAGNVTEA